MAFIGYARVSTQDQSLDYQVEKLNEEGCEKIFSGKQSGVSDQNWEKLNQLIDYIREGDIVLVTKLDRLGRSVGQIVGAIDRIHAKGASIKEIEGSVNTNGEDVMGRAMRHLMAVFAEIEHSTIVDRLQGGRRNKGRLGGRPKSYTPEQEKDVVLKLGEGVSVAKIARDYKLSRQTVMRIRDLHS